RHFLASGTNQRDACLQSTRVFEASSIRPAGPLLQPGGIVLDAAFAPDGLRVALASSTVKDRSQVEDLKADGSGNVQVWDWRSGRRRLGPLVLPREPRGLAYSPDGKRLAVICADGWLVLLRTSDGQRLHRIDTGNRATGNANLWTSNGLVRFSPDGRWLVTWEMDDALRVWDPGSGKLLHRLPHDERISDVEFGSAPWQLLSSGRDARARVWDLRSGKLLGPPLAHPRLVATARLTG